MTNMIQSIHAVHGKIDTAVSHFSWSHPYLAYFCVFTGIPIFMVGTVFLVSSIILLPFAWLFGWM